MILLIVSTLIKIVIVISILLGLAPILVWAERRQSAMMQDRVGPVRGGIPPLPWQVLALAGGGLALAAATGAVVDFLLSGPVSVWVILLLASAGGVALNLFATMTKISVPDFLRGPASTGAKAVGYGAAALGILAVLVLGYLLLVRSELHSAVADPVARHALIEDLAGAMRFLLFGHGPELAALENDPAQLSAMIDDVFGGVIQTWGWVIVGLFLASIFHFVAAWLVKHSVDKRGYITAFGLIHPAFDAAKMIWKEDFVPPKADKFLHAAAPILATVPAFATFAVIPFGPPLHWGSAEGHWYEWLFEVIPHGAASVGRVIPLQVVNINVGILYIFAIAGTGIVGAAIAGYSSDNKYALLGGLRAASQMVSYEVTLGLTLVGCFMVYGTLLLDQMVEWQQQHLWGFIVQPLGLILYFFSSMAEMKRVPFDAPEGESEIVAGYFLEYSGMKWGLFMTGEFVEHIVSGAIVVTLFFGGYDVPFLHQDGFHFFGFYAPVWHVGVVLISVVAFILKIGVVNFLQLTVRWTLPRFRYDQIMQLCWKLILPLSLANILVTGIFILMLQ